MTLFPQRRPERYLVAHVDGGARGNPGPAGYGVVIADQDGNKVAELSEFLGVRTNNFAEYAGLVAAVAWAASYQHKGLLVVSDSELLVKQLKGQYKVRAPELQALHQRAMEFIRQLEWFEVRHVPRAQNREADRLANQAMDSGMPGRAARADAYAQKPAAEKKTPREVNGVVKNGKVEFLGEPFPDGTPVKVRARE